MRKFFKTLCTTALLVCMTALPVFATQPADPSLSVPITVFMNSAGSYTVRIYDKRGVGTQVDSPEEKVFGLTIQNDDLAIQQAGGDIETVVTIDNIDSTVYNSVLQYLPEASTEQKRFAFDLTVEVKETLNNTVRNVSELPDTLTFSFAPPDDFTLDAVADAKMFCIHETMPSEYIVQVLPITYNKATNRVSFSTKYFSSYVLEYAAAKAAPAPDPTPAPTPTPTPAPTPAPSTPVKGEDTTVSNSVSSDSDIGLVKSVNLTSPPTVIETIMQPTVTTPVVQSVSTARGAKTEDSTNPYRLYIIAGALVIILLLLCVKQKHKTEESDQNTEH